jgi:hypothetical protein
VNKDYSVVDADGQPCGSLRLAICSDYSALDKVMPFGRLEESAEYYELADPHSFGFQYFEKQLPTTDIYPIAALLDLEIDYKKQKRGYGGMALGGFHAVAADHGARLGLLRIGTSAGESDYEVAMTWRKNFYIKHGWTAFNTPPIPGLILVWMYHLLPAPTETERLARCQLEEKKPEQSEFPPPE